MHGERSSTFLSMLSAKLVLRTGYLNYQRRALLCQLRHAKTSYYNGLSNRRARLSFKGMLKSTPSEPHNGYYGPSNRIRDLVSFSKSRVPCILLTTITKDSEQG